MIVVELDIYKSKKRLCVIYIYSKETKGASQFLRAKSHFVSRLRTFLEFAWTTFIRYVAESDSAVARICSYQACMAHRPHSCMYEY